MQRSLLGALELAGAFAAGCHTAIGSHFAHRVRAGVGLGLGAGVEAAGLLHVCVGVGG
jgi:hypothetical protein